MKKDTAIDQIYNAILEIREYFRHGIAEQLENQKDFGGKDAKVIISANRDIDETKPYVSKEIFDSAKSVVTTAEDEFNGFLDFLRSHISKEDEANLVLMTNSRLMRMRNIIEDKINIVVDHITKEKQNSSPLEDLLNTESVLPSPRINIGDNNQIGNNNQSATGKNIKQQVNIGNNKKLNELFAKLRSEVELYIKDSKELKEANETIKSSEKMAQEGKLHSLKVLLESLRDIGNIGSIVSDILTAVASIG